MRFRRTKFRGTFHRTVLRGLGPLMGLLALGAPIFSEPLAAWNRCALAGSAPDLRQASTSSLFLHPLTSLLRMAAAGSPSSIRVQGDRDAVLGWDALRPTALRGSLWMVRDHLPTAHRARRVISLRC